MDRIPHPGKFTPPSNQHTSQPSAFGSCTGMLPWSYRPSMPDMYASAPKAPELRGEPGTGRSVRTPPLKLTFLFTFPTSDNRRRYTTLFSYGTRHPAPVKTMTFPGVLTRCADVHSFQNLAIALSPRVKSNRAASGIVGEPLAGSKTVSTPGTC